MDKSSQIQKSSSNEKILEIQQEFVNRIIFGEFGEILSLLETKGNYFEKFSPAIDAIDHLKEINPLKGIVSDSLFVENNAKFVNSTLCSVWTFHFLRFSVNDYSSAGRLNGQMEKMQISLVLRVKNDKIFFLNWCTDYISEFELKKSVFGN